MRETCTSGSVGVLGEQSPSSARQLKSPHFVNSLYLNKPERIEALVYLILIAMMVLSVAERVVRRKMESEGETVIGPGGIKNETSQFKGYCRDLSLCTSASRELQRPGNTRTSGATESKPRESLAISRSTANGIYGRTTKMGLRPAEKDPGSCVLFSEI